MALLGPRGAAVMAETSGPESTNSCDHFSYFKPLGTRRLPSHQPGAVTQHCRPRARDRSLGACVSRAWVGFFFFKKREFHFLSTRLCQTVLVFSVHRLMSCHPYIWAERSLHSQMRKMGLQMSGWVNYPRFHKGGAGIRTWDSSSAG